MFPISDKEGHSDGGGTSPLLKTGLLDGDDGWPEAWPGYPRFLVVAVSVSRWDTLEPTRKRAMLDYAAAGIDTLVAKQKESRA